MTLITEKLSTEVEDIHHEDVPFIAGDEQGQALEINTDKRELVPIDKTIQQEVAKFNLPRAAIQAIKEKYADLPEKAKAGDKKAIKDLTEARVYVKKKRTAIEKTRKLIKADYLAIGTAIDGEAAELTKLLREIESPLEEAETEIENAAKEAREAVERAAQEKLQGRVADLLNNGMAFTGAYYTIGETISMDVVTLKDMPDAVFEELKVRVIKENNILLAAAAEKERVRLENEAALEEQRKQNEAEQARLQLANAALLESQKQLQQQQDEMKKEIVTMRRAQLLQLGFTINLDESMGFSAYTSSAAPQIENITIQAERIGEAGWVEFMAGIADMVKSINGRAEAFKAQAKIEQEEKEEKQRQLNRRRGFLEDHFGMDHIQGGEAGGYYIREFPAIGQDLRVAETYMRETPADIWELAIVQQMDEVFKEHIAAEKAETDKLGELAAKELEEERQAQLSDVVKMLEYGQKINAIKIPVVTDPNMVDILFEVTEVLDRMLQLGKWVEEQTRPAPEQ